MKTWIAVGAGLMAIGAGAWWAISRQAQLPASDPVAATEPAAWVPATDDARLGLQFDPAEVFQRAFWRRAAPEDRILHAERRHWRAEGRDSVERWQWFIVVDPSQAFADWLLNENPFELTTVVPGGVSLALDDAPRWMPGAKELSGYAHYHKPGGNLHVFRDPRTGLIYATDQGGGFTLARK